ncbi:MAG: hypothetical protein E4H13_09320 [Calditrichales bacterium]|nr:MAG: hypothetical protein E4H13_09320 [Calditrichales bacterium]
MKTHLQLFAPKSIAVIGASRRDGSLGKMFLDAIVRMDYQGTVYPINPKAEQINNIPCYPDIQSLPAQPDLAVILLPKEMVLNVVQDLADHGIKNVVVISAGFREVGAEGALRETALLDVVRKNGMRMIGPNSMGLFNTAPGISLNATFSPTLPLRGHVGFISQSGALGVAVLELSQALGLGFSHFTSTGNKADVGDVECLQFLAEDAHTKTIILYQEGIDRPDEFRRVCTRIVKEKPILTLKAGRTGSGLRAASSHTGALASDDIITDAFFKQCGVIRCDSLNDLLDSARVFTDRPLPDGNRVAVITNAGGPGILASDALEKNGSRLATLSANTISRLKEILPAEAGLHNPVDMIASANHDTYQKVARIVVEDAEVDTLFIIIVKPPVATTPEQIIQSLAPLIRGSRKNFIFTVMAQAEAGNGDTPIPLKDVAVFSYPEAAARALGHMHAYVRIQKQFSGQNKELTYPESAVFVKGLQKKQLPQQEIIRRLTANNIPSCQQIISGKLQEILAFQQKTGTIVLKIANETILHKSDQGLVKTNLSDKAAVESAFKVIREKSVDLLTQNQQPVFWAQEMIPSGMELVLGCHRDALFGPVIMFGLGGVTVELYKDVSFRVLPVDQNDAVQMIEELKGSKIFNGFRQFPAVDKDVLVRTIMNFAQMIQTTPDIIEMDLNPLIWPAGYKNPVVVDSRCTVSVNA